MFVLDYASCGSCWGVAIDASREVWTLWLHVADRTQLPHKCVSVLELWSLDAWLDVLISCDNTLFKYTFWLNKISLSCFTPSRAYVGHCPKGSVLTESLLSTSETRCFVNVSHSSCIHVRHCQHLLGVTVYMRHVLVPTVHSSTSTITGVISHIGPCICSKVHV